MGNYASDATIDANIFLTSHNLASGVVGLAWIRTVCGPEMKYRTSIAEYFSNDITTSEVMKFKIYINSLKSSSYKIFFLLIKRY